ncbi:acyl-CoA dehydrogenase [Caenimonas sp. SL110]|uniref:acyl-CoA dehydrogenase n=1 Tax=Caenimonas sp. SL110 TaxID=1450524 RepID=UPI000652F619|nr:acyl-CoA dehydrogenase [Caenimonas sp. SL110]
MNISSQASAHELDIDHLRGWIGKSETRHDVLDTFPVRALAGLLDRDSVPREGDALPLAWQWMYFLDTPARAATGVDGHPARGGFLPPVPLPRRMWAAGKLKSLAPLVIGRGATKTSTVRNVELKQGKAGPLVFVTLSHEFAQDGQACLVEEQNLVYRQAPTAAAPLPPGELAAASASWARSWHADHALLFRYSALTYNGHRIHYDRDYATQAEFYPALVVHGPLLATLLLDLVHRQRPDVRPSAFEFRAQRPAFDTDELTICGIPDEAGASLWTADAAGHVGVKARASF